MKIRLTQLPSAALRIVGRIGRFRVVLFIIFIVLLYGYLVFQIGQASSVQPSSGEQTAVKNTSPRIDPAVVEKLQQLQDNSVTVQALFNQARTNPFQ